MNDTYNAAGYARQPITWYYAEDPPINAVEELAECAAAVALIVFVRVSVFVVSKVVHALSR